MILPHDSTAGEQLNAIIRQETANGFIGGIVAFMTANKVKLRHEKEDKSVLKEFTSLILAEWDEDKSKYPFTDSLKMSCALMIDSERPNLEKVFMNGEYNNLKRYIRVVSGTCIAQFLEEHRNEVLTMIRKMRGLDN